MKLTIESIGEREIHFINYQLFAPQMLQNIELSDETMIISVYNGACRNEWIYNINTKKRFNNPVLVRLIVIIIQESDNGVLS